jgi:hypothetical protein
MHSIETIDIRAQYGDRGKSDGHQRKLAEDIRAGERLCASNAAMSAIVESF